ncbi:NADP-dependent oxidoreductase [Albibacterium sp.]|uniref:NADP-dependent oxidoreductase n=1 Tax=Albibacterium sp. TaxID=2952885 RepID=UPI002C4A4B2C|nr:NADP-dependent oxidoreductase [Albibacterium sp.]HUH20033.1 NADP-dependent oxidoreductase [Albibacterium sp.]
MKAIVIKEFGNADKLQLAEVKRPECTEDQLLIKVMAAGLNPVDTKIRSGRHISCSTLQLPAILGKDMSGIVEVVGGNVKGFKVGDPVFGCINSTYAAYAVASPEFIVKKPEKISFEVAAAVSLAGLTAYQAINDHLNVSSGQRVLIQSAAGGVGHLAVQFAKLQGAFVYGTASGKNIEFLKDLGVDQPINYKEERFEDIATNIDAVMDTMGGEILYRSIALVKPGGKVVCLPSSTKDDPKAIALAQEKGVDLIWFMMQPEKGILQTISDLLNDEKLRVEIQQIFPMQEIAQAHQLIETHGVRGKIVVRLE